jgi:cytochrome b pre-mRNA-processing protein 3
VRRLVILERLFRRNPARIAGESLYEAATKQARQPAFYADLEAPDTVEGRFELYTLHVVLLLHRLKGLDVETAAIAQALFDAYLQALDDALREMGVGDLSVAKKMRKLGEAFYGRAKAYEAALTAADPGELNALIGRTIYADVVNPPLARLTAYIQRCVETLAALPLEEVIAAHLTWPEVLA